MAATIGQLIALGNDNAFRLRIRTIMLQQAGAVYVESTATGYLHRSHLYR